MSRLDEIEAMFEATVPFGEVDELKGKLLSVLDERVALWMTLAPSHVACLLRCCRRLEAVAEAARELYACKDVVPESRWRVLFAALASLDREEGGKG